MTPGALQTTYTNANVTFDREVFITKLSPDGTALEYSTYLGAPGGSLAPLAQGIAVDTAGSAYVVGEQGGGVSQRAICVGELGRGGDDKKEA